MSNQIQPQVSSDQEEQTPLSTEESVQQSVQNESYPQSLVEQVVTPVPVSFAEVVVPVTPTVQTPPTVIPNVVKATSKSTVTDKTDYPEVTGIPDADRVLKTVPAAHQVGIQRLMEYATKMDPRKPIDPPEGAKAQVTLFRIIQNTINREETYFRQIFAAILAMFTHDKTGVFKEANVFRFMDNVALNETERKAFVRLVDMIKLLGPKDSRAVALKQVDMSKTLQMGLTDEGRRRILNFFNINK
jgi:hypothetical protein